MPRVFISLDTHLENDEHVVEVALLIVRRHPLESSIGNPQHQDVDRGIDDVF